MLQRHQCTKIYACYYYFLKLCFYTVFLPQAPLVRYLQSTQIPILLHSDAAYSREEQAPTLLLYEQQSNRQFFPTDVRLILSPHSANTLSNKCQHLFLQSQCNKPSKTMKLFVIFYEKKQQDFYFQNPTVMRIDLSGFKNTQQ